MDRRKPTTLDKLKVMVAQARCPRCKGKLGTLAETEFDHVHPLALGGADDITNLVAVHVDCHAVKTRGSGATTAGSDIGNIAKTKRLAEKTREFEQNRRKILAPTKTESTRDQKPKYKWPKRPFRNAKA